MLGKQKPLSRRSANGVVVHKSRIHGAIVLVQRCGRLVNSPPNIGLVSNHRNPLGPVSAENKPGSKRSYRVKVVNSIWNGPGTIRRKKAEHYVSVGRAEWVAPDQVRMVTSHPENRAAAARAKEGYVSITRTMSLEEIARLPMARPRVAYMNRSLPTNGLDEGRGGPVRYP
jgi:hypothetical protein